MVFSSNEFLFLYLPFALILYFFAPKGRKNSVLFLVSLIFYSWEAPKNLALMLFVILANYVFGILTEKFSGEKKAQRAILILAVVLNVFLLALFKYVNFVASTLFGHSLEIVLPIGISFYIFQSISYVIDVYRGDVRARRSFIDFGAYITMFPQLIAGPIVRYSDIERELSSREHTMSRGADGARRFVCGLAKKVLLADMAGALFEQIEKAPRGMMSVLVLWLGLIMYAFQIYFDFSGYSDMAIGLGMILGFHFPENFNYPYTATSITDFWRRWHITLSTWFREYVYIPLGGNRVGRGRMIFNLFVVWLLTGIWHGASVNFALWGLYYFVLLTAEKIFLGAFISKLPRAVARLYALFFILLGWLIFYFKPSEGGFSSLASYFCGMFGFLDIPFANSQFLYEFLRNFVFLLILAFASTKVPRRIWGRVRKGREPLFDLITLAIFLLCVAYISSSEYRPNIYFEF